MRMSQERKIRGVVLHRMKTLNILLALLLWGALPAHAGQPAAADSVREVRSDGIRNAFPAFTVRLNGTVRAKFEYQPDIGKGRFEVRNARFSLSGNVTPTVSYKAEIDLSDEGSIKMLDAYVRLNMRRKTAGHDGPPFASLSKSII